MHEKGLEPYQTTFVMDSWTGRLENTTPVLGVLFGVRIAAIITDRPSTQLCLAGPVLGAAL